MHALIIEPQAFTACAIEFALRDIGYTSFDFAADTDTAVACAEERRPDLITSAVDLAPGCGISAVQQICGGSDMPVLFITHQKEQVRESEPDAGVVGKVPFSVDEIGAAAELAGPLRR